MKNLLIASLLLLSGALYATEAETCVDDAGMPMECPAEEAAE